MKSQKQLIMEEVANDPAYLDACKKISKQEGQTTRLYLDLYQECMLILMEKPEEEIIAMYNNRSLKFFFVRIVMNQWNSGGKEGEVKGSSPFWNKYRRHSHNFAKTFEQEFNFDFSYEEVDNNFFHKKLMDGSLLIEEDTTFDNMKKLSEAVEEIIEELNWFDYWILILYLEGDWTFTTLAQEIGIGRNKVNDSIQRSKKYIKERLDIKISKKHIW
jgi:hypothetical protein